MDTGEKREAKRKENIVNDHWWSNGIMANDNLSNGRLQENTIVQRTRYDRGKRGIERR